MVFSSLLFLFRFLPLFLALYFLVPRKLRNGVLFIGSLIFYGWGEHVYISLLLFSTLVDFFHGKLVGRFLERGNRKAARMTVASSAFINLALLVIFKYTDFFIRSVNSLTGSGIPLLGLALPIGISFYTFQTMSYTIDVYRGEAPVQNNIISFGAYVSMFPQLIAGPIVRYQDIAAELNTRTESLERFSLGIRRFVVGLGKKVLLANTLGTTFYALSALPMTQLSTLSAWLGAVCYALMLYFDFSGYSDMAIGLASMFGFRFGKNFDYPYVSQSITEFWRRWHISLGAWFRDYVYIPCGGSRAGTVRTIANLLLVWLLTGIWHGANWTFLLWGVYYGILLLLEKFVLRRVLEHLPGLLRHVLTLLLVLIGWVFFFSSSPAAAFGWIGRMFGSGNALVDATAKYYLAGCWPLLLVGAIGSFPVVSHVGTNLLRRSKAWQAFSVVLFLALLLLCIALMMNDTYSTFLYFQF